MRSLLLSAALSGLLMGCFNPAPPTPPSPHKVSEIRYVMGTLLDITIYAPSVDEGRAVLNDTFAVAERLDAALSTWKPESPVSVFNRDRSTHLRSVDSDLYEVVVQ